MISGSLACPFDPMDLAVRFLAGFFGALGPPFRPRLATGSHGTRRVQESVRTQVWRRQAKQLIPSSTIIIWRQEGHQKNAPEGMLGPLVAKTFCSHPHLMKERPTFSHGLLLKGCHLQSLNPSGNRNIEFLAMNPSVCPYCCNTFIPPPLPSTTSNKLFQHLDHLYARPLPRPRPRPLAFGSGAAFALALAFGAAPLFLPLPSPLGPFQPPPRGT